ncbi:unnamed protein product [Allacma fusca]|uniref:Uncharacterized protein n=1 Tax=Allacma fusca TaxID=39272 RepID=A0A8J2LYA9_9HEXA|nr:unnamed protein product [Allacma fusca]
MQLCRRSLHTIFSTECSCSYSCSICSGLIFYLNQSLERLSPASLKMREAPPSHAPVIVQMTTLLMPTLAAKAERIVNEMNP